MATSEGVPKDEKPTAALQIHVSDDQGLPKHKRSKCSLTALLGVVASLLVVVAGTTVAVTYFIAPSDSHFERIAGFSQPRFSPFLGEPGLNTPSTVSPDGRTISQNVTVPGPQGRALTLHYHAELIDDAYDRMLMLDHDPDIADVQCASGRIHVEFHSIDLAVQFLQRASVNGSLITGGPGWNCSASGLDNTPTAQGEKSTIILRSVTMVYVAAATTGRRLSNDSATGVAISDLVNSPETLAILIGKLRSTGGRSVMLGTQKAEYHHVFKHANVSFHTNHYPHDYFD